MPFTALCIEMPAAAPEWIQILPGGATIKGIDGREWRNNNPDRLIDLFKNMGLPLVVDYEHGQELKAPNGDEAPAAGWVEDLELRNGTEVWAKVSWTERAATAINSREYRFISPAFTHNSNGEILGFSSVALCNKPNLIMQALNHRESSSGWDEVSAAIGTKVSSCQDVLQALNHQKNSIEQADAESVVGEYIKKAVFPPSQKSFLIACCRSQGIEDFRKFADQQPGFNHLLNEVKVHKASPSHSKLSDIQLAVCKQVGVTEEQFINVKEKGI